MVPGFFWRRTIEGERVYFPGNYTFILDHKPDAFAHSILDWEEAYPSSARDVRRWAKENLSGRWHVDANEYMSMVRIWEDIDATLFMMRFV